MSDWRSVATLNSINFTAPNITLTDGSGSHSGSTAKPLFSVGLPGEPANIVNMRNEHDDKTVHTISTKFTATNDKIKDELPFWTEGSHMFVSNPAVPRQLEPEGDAWSLGRLNQVLSTDDRYLFSTQEDLDLIIRSFSYVGVLISNARMSSEFTYPTAKLSLNFQGLSEKVHDVWGVNTNKSHWLWFIVKPIPEGQAKKKDFEFVKSVPPNPHTDNIYTSSKHGRYEEKYDDSDDFSDGQEDEFTGALHAPAAPAGGPQRYRVVIRPYWTPAEEHPALKIYQSPDSKMVGTCILVGKWYDLMRPRNDESLKIPEVVCNPTPGDYNVNLANSTRRLFISGGAAWSYGL